MRDAAELGRERGGGGEQEDSSDPQGEIPRSQARQIDAAEGNLSSDRGLEEVGDIIRGIRVVFGKFP